MIAPIRSVERMLVANKLQNELRPGHGRIATGRAAERCVRVADARVARTSADDRETCPTHTDRSKPHSAFMRRVRTERHYSTVAARM